MVSKPTDFPTWATMNRTDPTSGQNNVTTPPLEKQQYGWNFNEQPPRNWFNWLGRYTNNWLVWLDQQESQSKVTDNSGTSPVVDVSTGGLVQVAAVDAGDATKWYFGQAYVPPNPVSPVTLIGIGSPNLTASTISVTGVVTMSGGTGPYIIYGQTKTIPT